MAIDLDYFADDLAAMIGDLPARMKYVGKECNVSVSDHVRTTTVQMTGEMEDIDFTVEVLASDVQGLPAIEADARIEVRRVGEKNFSRYTVVNVRRPADSAGLTLAVAADRRN